MAACVILMTVQSSADYFTYTQNGPRERLTTLIWLLLACAVAHGQRGAEAPSRAGPSRMPQPQA